MQEVIVIGAGLAGSEAAWQLARRGVPVLLVEMKPKKKTPAHSADTFAELVCSNSLRSDALTNAAGLLKEEMRTIGSLILEKADQYRVPAGSALAVDRVKFSQAVTDALRQEPLITIEEREVDAIPAGPAIIASGPLTSEALMGPIRDLFQDQDCYFYDAEAPIVTADSIDFRKAYRKSRYDKGEADYVNCPLNRQEFEAFYQAVLQAETVPIRGFEQEVYFEGCMPFEVMARRGRNTLLFGPMKPVGLEKDGVRPYAVVQLRQDNVEASLYNIVGFQTHLTWPAQKQVLHMIPGLEHCEIVRYGVMHRNTYINSPRRLKPTYQTRVREDLFFAGQITGVEGYIESASSGLLAGINMAHYMHGEPLAQLGPETVIGALPYYITHADPEHFQPMKASFAIVHLEKDVPKKQRREAYALQSLPIIRKKVETHEL